MERDTYGVKHTRSKTQGHTHSGTHMEWDIEVGTLTVRCTDKANSFGPHFDYSVDLFVWYCSSC